LQTTLEDKPRTYRYTDVSFVYECNEDVLRKHVNVCG
jgi:hypothetical protein